MRLLVKRARRPACYEYALNVFRRRGDLRGQSFARGNLANIHAETGDIQRALDEYENVLIIAKETKDRQSEALAIFQIGLMLNRAGDLVQAISHAEKALKIFEKIDDSNAALVSEQLAAWRRRGANGE